MLCKKTKQVTSFAHLDSLTKCFKNDDDVIDLQTIQSLCYKICLNIFGMTDKLDENLQQNIFR